MHEYPPGRLPQLLLSLFDSVYGLRVGLWKGMNYQLQIRAYFYGVGEL